MANTPNPAENLTLGKGALYFNKLNQETKKYEGFRDLGNAPVISANITPDKLAHYSSRGGLKAKDYEIIKELALKFTFTLDEPNQDNLQMMFMSETEEIVQAVLTDSTISLLDINLDRYYLLDAKDITVTEVSLTAAPTTIYVAGTDFTVDSKNGRIYFPVTSTIAAGEDLTITFDAAAKTYNKLKSLKETKVEGMLQFISDNPTGENYNMIIWKTNLTPSGDIGLITDEWMSLSYEAEVLRDEINHADSPYMDIDFA